MLESEGAMNTSVEGVAGAAERAFAVVQGKVQLKNLLCHLRAQVKILEAERRDRMLALGQALFLMHQRGPVSLETLGDRLQQADDTEQRLTGKRQELMECEVLLHGRPHQSDDVTSCPACHAVRPAGTRFCMQCGRASMS